ncbi:MAG: enoyl-CoA hydratase/isomerase family protein [Pararhodobacter sp.]
MWLVLDRPPVNALDIAFCNELAEQLDTLSADTNGGPVVITGAGASFSAGVDLKTVVGGGQAEQDEMLHELNRVFLSAYRFPRPLIGAINGHAIAGGLVLALTCDVRIGVDDTAKFGLAEVRVGIPYPVAAIEIVKAELGKNARRFVLLGQPVDARSAHAAGVLDELCAPGELTSRANALASAASALPSIGFGKIKRQLREEVLAKSARAVAGEEPLLGNWMAPETLSASKSALYR